MSFIAKNCVHADDIMCYAHTYAELKQYNQS